MFRTASLPRVALIIAMALTTFAPANPVFAGTNVWTSHGPYGVEIQTLAIDPLTPATLYAGTPNAGVYKSTDGGGSWSLANNGLTIPHVYADVRALAIDPTRPATLYAGTIGGGVFKSTDGAASWIMANTGLTSTVVFALAIDPATPATLYAGTFDGVFKSTNGGGNWSLANTGVIGLAQVLAIDPSTPATLYVATEAYAGGYSGRVYKSTNGGGNWSPADTGLPAAAVRAVVIDPMTPGTLYAGEYYGHGGVFKSTNGGGSWSQADGGQFGASIRALAIDPAAPTILYAGSGIVFKSTNGGESWAALSAGLTSASVNALAIDPAAPATLYAGTSGGGVYTIQQVLSLSPGIGLTTGGTTITIRGLHFTPTSGVTVTLGSVAATNVTVLDSITLTATTDAHTPGVVDVVVTNPDQHHVTLPSGFVYADVIYQSYLPVTSR